MSLQILEKEILQINSNSQKELLIIINDIKKSSKLANLILNDLMTYAQLASNKLKMNKKSFLIIPLINRIITIFKNEANKNNICLNFQYSNNNNNNNNNDNTVIINKLNNNNNSNNNNNNFNDNIIINGDENYLFKAINNIIDRALTSAGNGGNVVVKVYQTTTSSDNKQMLNIEVEDSGPNITQVK